MKLLPSFYRTYEGLKRISFRMRVSTFSTCFYRTYEGLKQARYGYDNISGIRFYRTYEGLKLISSFGDL